MFTTRPEIAGTFGVVATTHWLASAVAMAVLERGGNAFDAAVAAGFTLQVAEPHLNGPGGDLPIIIHDAKANRQHVICGQGVSPTAATPAKFAELGLDLVPGTGLLPAVVPGAFDGWATMLRDWGTMELADVLEYAIGYATNGVHLVPRIPAAIEAMRPMFEQEWKTSAEVWLPGGNTPAPGALFRRPKLAETWRRLIREATGTTREARIDSVRNAWYRGWVAEAIGRFYANEDILDASGRRHRGLLTADDMARWAASVEDPIAYDYHGTTVLKVGPWSQAPAMLQTLALLKGFDIAAMDPDGADFVHTVVEAMKLAYADREAYYGDPDHAEVPLAHLLGDAYNDERRALIGAAASMELRPGTVPGFTPMVDREASKRADLLTRAPGVGEPTVARLGAIGGDTCHVDVIDRWGNMVSATPSGGWLQSSPVIPELGFPLSTRGQMFWVQQGHPNSLAPRKRPRTTLSPSMALRGGKAWLSFGTPGGDQQDQWQTVMFLRMVHHRLNIQQAIDAPNFHSDHWPSSFWPRVARPGRVVIEGRYAPAVLEDLKARGHDASQGEPWSEGRLSGARLEDDGQMHAGANPRGMQGYAIGR
ncbi:MAG: gamma-glutamyltransferase family protein [Acetobacteraceae bacterium]|nr:gamma-glutamyltransferase family protein [Acetobacteraceae bacterium]